MKLLEYASSNQSANVDLTSSSDDQQLAQRFRLYRPGGVGRVSLWLKKTGSPAGFVYVEIHPTSSNNPSGTALSNAVSDTVPTSSISSSYGWINFDFKANAKPILSDDAYYHIVLKSSGYTYADGTTEIVWGADQTAPHYLDGEGETYDGSSWSNLSTGTDFCFRIYSGTRTVYGDISRVEALVCHLTQSGNFDNASRPTITAVLDLQEDVASEIDSWFAGAGFDTPITNTDVLAMIANAANAGTAMMCELTQVTAGFRAERGSDTRTGAFRTLYYGLRDDLREDGEFIDVLLALGLERVSAGQLGRGLSAGGVEDDEHDDWDADTTLLKPHFERDMWDNP